MKSEKDCKFNISHLNSSIKKEFNNVFFELTSKKLSKEYGEDSIYSCIEKYGPNPDPGYSKRFTYRVSVNSIIIADKSKFRNSTLSLAREMAVRFYNADRINDAINVFTANAFEREMGKASSLFP